MAPQPATQVKVNPDSDIPETPNVLEPGKGIRGVLLGPPGSGKGTQVRFV